MVDQFLSNRSQSVRVGNCYSDFIPVLSGVPQGSVSGPLLFLLYINDIVDLFGNDLTVKLFADDVKMYVNISDVKNVNPRTADRLFLHGRRGDAKLQPPSNFGTRRDTNMISVSTPMFSGSKISMVLVPTLSDAPFYRKSRWRTGNRKRVACE